MKMMRFFALVLLVALALVSASRVQAQDNSSKCTPLSPEALEEIIATRGTAFQKYCPHYVVLGVAVRKTTPLTREMLAEIIATRGSAAAKYVPQYAFEIIPVTSASTTQGTYMPVTREMIEEINATRGAALLKYWGK